MMRCLFQLNSAALALALMLAACSSQSGQNADGQDNPGGADLASQTEVLAASSGVQADEAGAEPASGEGGGTTDGTAAAEGGSDERSLFQAAGFTYVQQRKQWESGICGDPPMGIYEPGAIEHLGDINGDGRPEAFVRESGICYGNIGQHFWLLSRQPNGQWKPMLDAIAIPEFLATRGTDNFPDIQMGGPGFCFPVVRWNGREYKIDRHEYEGKPCDPV